MGDRNERQKRTRVVAFSAMLVALGAVLLWLSAVMPTASLALAALAGVVPTAAVLMSGIPAGFSVYAATALLALLVVPDKGTVLSYALLFGHYPVVKSIAERTKSRIAEWAIKLGVFNAVFAVCVFAAAELVFAFPIVGWMKLAAFLAGNVVFVIYDYGFSGLISFYLSKFGRILGRK